MLSRLRKLCTAPRATLQSRSFAWRQNARLRAAPIDPRIHYPCYQPMDRFIDVTRLRGLHESVRAGVLAEHAPVRHPEFATTITRHWWEPRTARTRLIHLRAASRGTEYLAVNRPELWRDAPAARRFPELMAFVATLPFAAIGRVVIFYDLEPSALVAHRDHWRPDLCHEFLWLRTDPSRRLFMECATTGARQPVTSSSAWFDTVNQFHGSAPSDGLSFAIRVDGVFDDQLRRELPTPADNRASTAALWACLDAARGRPPVGGTS
ncbi:MAG: hypothetical protein AAF628_12415 [Planctomycetota bacterium]